MSEEVGFIKYVKVKSNVWSVMDGGICCKESLLSVKFIRLVNKEVCSCVKEMEDLMSK